MYYDKDEIKNSLTLEQVFDILISMGGDPIKKNGYIISKTICHNPPHEGSYKLWYYDNTKLFRCWTDCPEESGFDIFALVQKKKKELSLFDAIRTVASFFGISGTYYDKGNFEDFEKLDDWEYFKRREELKELEENLRRKFKKIQLEEFSNDKLKNLPRPRILPWEKEGIKEEVCKRAGIAFNPISNGIVIPHYDIDNRLIGIRERTLIKELEKDGKYKPSILRKKMYAHPLGLNLYNINNSKNGISLFKKAIVFESEKSCLLYRSFFGDKNDISVAVCGSNLTQQQFDILFRLKVNEVIIAFDKQFQDNKSEEFIRWTKKLTDIHNKYKAFATISFMFDKWNFLDYKDSPIDKGKDIFLQLFKRRHILPYEVH